MAISASPSGGSSLGICGSTSPRMRCSSRLVDALPGRMAAPLRPPSSASPYVASDNPPLRLSWLWHSRHLASKMGLTCRS
jgi:hypothetical protein